MAIDEQRLAKERRARAAMCVCVCYCALQGQASTYTLRRRIACSGGISQQTGLLRSRKRKCKLGASGVRARCDRDSPQQRRRQTDANWICHMAREQPAASFRFRPRVTFCTSFLSNMRAREGTSANLPNALCVRVFTATHTSELDLARDACATGSESEQALWCHIRFRPLIAAAAAASVDA